MATPGIGSLVKAIAHDLKTIAGTEAELTREKLAQYLEREVMRAAVVILGAIVAVIGLAMLSVVGVLLLRPWIELYWPRLLIMGVFYIVFGTVVVRWFIGHVLSKPDLTEVKETAAAIERGVES